MRVTCPLCNSSQKKLVRDRIRYDVKRSVYRCAKCSMVYLERLPPGEAAAYYASKDYRARYGPKPGTAVNAREIFDTYRPFQAPIVVELKKILKPSMKVLDVGCSTGHFLDALKGKVKTRVGLELGKDEVEFIQKNLDFKVYDVPIEDADITEGPFDLITCFQVLEHIEEPIPFLKQLARNLKPGGYLYLELPNLDDALLSQYDIAGYRDFYYREPHVSYFSGTTLKKALGAAGFSGKIGSVQRYNILNHMHWFLTGKPQGNFTVANSTPVLVKGKSKPAHELNAWIKRADEEYRALIAKLGLGESLSFIGRKRR